MQSRNRVFDDLARVTNGAASVLSGFRDEAEAKIRQQLERLLADMDMVSREEFEAVREMAANARREQEALAIRVAELESRVGAVDKPKKAKRATRKATDETAGKADPDSQGSPGALD